MFTILQALASSDKTVEIIKAIGSVWPLLVVIVFTTIFVIYRKQLGLYLSKFNKVSGKTPLVEVNFEKQTEDQYVKNQIFEEKVVKEISKEGIQNNELTVEPEISFHDIYLKLCEGKISEANNQFLVIQTKETNPIIKEENHITFLYYKQMYSNTNTLLELQEKVDNTTNNAVKNLGNRFLADCYFNSKDYELALKKYFEAYAISQDESERTQIILDVSNCYRDMGKNEKAIDYLKGSIKKTSNKINIAKIYFRLSSFYDISSNWVEKCLALELAVNNNPNNQSYLFEAAFNCSNTDGENNQSLLPLSVLHYTDLVRYNGDSSAGFNNLGVAFDSFKLKNKAIEMYRKAHELKETLASSNIANKYLAEGFFQEAKILLNTAKLEDDVHQNVWDSLKKIADEEEREEKEEKRILSEAKLTQMFLRDFATIFFSDDLNISTDYSGVWKFNNEIVEMTPQTNPEIVVLSWTDNGDRYKANLKLKNTLAFIEEGECIRNGYSYHSTKLMSLGMLSDNSIKIILLDKENKTQLNRFVFCR